MLGWELPPYNSGGLGTACLGLTRGLSKQDTAIRFVIPKLFGKLPYDHMDVVSAADYTDPRAVKTLLQFTPADADAMSRTLGYGASMTADEQERLWVDHLGNSHSPIAPETQAAWYAQQSKAIAEDSTFEVVHAHDWMTYYAGIAAKSVSEAKGNPVPFIAHVHATEIDRCGENGDPRIISIEREGLNQADHVVAVSEYTKQRVHKHYGVPLSKISVVYNGIPAESVQKKHDLSRLKEKHKIVLFMGRITMQKGPEYFVKLAKAVTERDPSVRFVMVGSGDMEQGCIEEAARQGLTGKLLFSSFLRGEDVDRAYQLADLFVMPSVSEPFGIVALEAIQNGTPALVSKQSGICEVSNNLIKVDFWDIDTMSFEVLRVLKSPLLLRTLKEKSQRDLQNLTWDHSATTMRDIYRTVIKHFQVGVPVVLHA